MPDLSPLAGTAVLRPLHARRVWTEKAICGDVGPSQWTNELRYVDCSGCIAEIERRLAARKDATP